MNISNSFHAYCKEEMNEIKLCVYSKHLHVIQEDLRIKT